MRLRYMACICLIGIFFITTAGGDYAADGESFTEQEQREAQQTAQLFVKRMQETRDVAPLIDELFLSDFVSHFVSSDDSVSPVLYARLTGTERLRLFIAQVNLSYLITLDIKSEKKRNYSEGEADRAAFKSILPAAVAERLRTVAWRDGELRFSSYQDFQSRLPELEKLLSEARDYLIKCGIEQTPEFRRTLDDTVQGTGVNYRVRMYVGGEEIKDCEPLAGFPPTQKFFRVETPLLMGLILVKAGGRMKIVRVTGVDGD